jgi:oligopeptide transport system substrate-binding protein
LLLRRFSNADVATGPSSNMSYCAERNARVRLRRLGGVLAFALATVTPSLACSATLRIVDNAVETLDPARAPDSRSQAAAGTLFDQLYTYDYLARPPRLRPLAASALPNVSADGREITVTIRRGIYFTAHPAFGGRARELVAEDFVYSVKRFMDPALRSPIASLITGKIEGLDGLVTRTAKTGARFDYDAKVSGLIAVDRFTLRIRLTQPDPAFVYFLANPDLSIVPREAVEADGDEFARKPTGSGPYVVREFKPGIRLVLERNPSYRVVRWEDVATPGPNDPAWAMEFRGRRYPMADRVEWLVIPEPTTRLLALERGEVDVIPAPPAAIENDALAPRLARSGFKLVRAPTQDQFWFSFNLRDPAIGGTTPANIALRRALAMAIDDDEYVRVILNGSGRVPRNWIPQDILGHDPLYVYPIRYEPATANALLDRFGFRKGPDGYRLRPDGSELTLMFQVGNSSKDRQFSEFLKRSFDRIGLRFKFEALPRFELISRQETCHYQLQDTGGWAFDWPEASNILLAFYGQSNGSVNMACVQDHEFDELYDHLRATPLGAQRAPIYRRIFDRLDAITPVRLLPTRDYMYVTAPNVRGLLARSALWAMYPYIDVTPGAQGGSRN